MVEDQALAAGLCGGYILDGFPRTIAQAEWLDGYLARTRIRNGPLIAVSLIVDYEVLLQRITDGSSLPQGRIYNVYTNPPQIPGAVTSMEAPGAAQGRHCGCL